MHSDFIKLISLNIEKDNHLSLIIPFLHQRKPDIILLQEIFLNDIPIFENTLGMKSIFAVMKTLVYGERQKPFGIAIFSSLPIVDNFSIYFSGDGASPPIGPEGNPLEIARCILGAEILKDSKVYRFINTHFTWTPDGQDSAQQHKDLQSLFQLLSQLPEFVLCGDFNAPRGRVIFDKISSKYKDNIPSTITTTLDKNFHRAGDLQLVVDGIFSTPVYTVEDVEVINGLSDHCAISAKIFIN